MENVEPISDDERKEIRKIQRRILRLGILVLFYVPSSAFVYRYIASSLAGPYAIIYLLFTGWTGLKVVSSRCPRCHVLYWCRFYQYPFRDVCQKCGLKI